MLTVTQVHEVSPQVVSVRFSDLVIPCLFDAARAQISLLILVECGAGDWETGCPHAVVIYTELSPRDGCLWTDHRTVAPVCRNPRDRNRVWSPELLGILNELTDGRWGR